MEQFINKVIQGDCLEIMRQLPDKSIDLVLTDPPYGINVAQNGTVGGGSHRGRAKDFGKKDWDKEIPTKEYFDEMIRVSKNQVIFGGNYFTQHLPPSSCWVVWDKRCGITPERTFADGEMAWTSFKEPTRIVRYLWDGMIQQDMKNKEAKWHPTMKPLEVMKFCIDRFSKEGDVILDPFAGSCTTLIAAQMMNRKYIGVEREEDYIKVCDIRLSAVQPSLL